LSYFDEISLKCALNIAGFNPLFIGTIPLYASPYFQFGVRKFIVSYYDNINYKFIKGFLLFLNRVLTLVKRYIIYYPLNQLILLLKLPGNSIFFVAEKKH